MAIGFNSNDYGITRKEFKQFKKEMQLKDLQNDNIELTKQDYKEIKAHIKNGDLGAYLDNVSEEMRNAIGLSLSGKVDNKMLRTERVNNMIKMLPADVDRAKVLNHIRAANEARIEETITRFLAPIMGTLETQATEARAEQSLMQFKDIVDRITESRHSNENN